MPGFDVSHVSVFVMMMPVVCATCTVCGPGFVCTHEAVPLGQALIPDIGGGKVSVTAQTVPSGTLFETVTDWLGATFKDTAAIPLQLATMANVEGLDTPRVFTTFLKICSEPPVDGAQARVLVTVSSAVWPATIVTGAE
ncbi:MAG: hypothetical protein ABIT61_05560 [Steroidobacteraceae bacterium]